MILSQLYPLNEVAVAVLTRIQGVLCWGSGWATDYPEAFRDFLQSLQTNAATLRLLCQDLSSLIYPFDVMESVVKEKNLPYILESNPHHFYSFRGLKNQMGIRIECGLDSRSRAGFWKIIEPMYVL
jgi:hypothetical protein